MESLNQQRQKPTFRIHLQIRASSVRKHWVGPQTSVTPWAGANSACGIVPKSAGVDGGTGLSNSVTGTFHRWGTPPAIIQVHCWNAWLCQDPCGLWLASAPWTRSVFKNKAQRNAVQSERKGGRREREKAKKGRKKDRTNLECRTRIYVAGSPEGPCESWGDTRMKFLEARTGGSMLKTEGRRWILYHFSITYKQSICTLVNV